MRVARRQVVLGVVAVVLAFALAPAGADASARPAKVTEGTLMWRAVGDTTFGPAPLLSTDVVIRVTGPIVRATVRQQFTNPSARWAEGVYVFPLPEDAAVDRLRMHVGDRVIEGQIQERMAAKAAYEQAKQEGKRASLVEQERPNVFTTSVANIAPAAAITIEIEYQHRVRSDAGDYRLRFPMVVGPRYTPRDEAGAEYVVGTGGTNEVPDADRVTPPVQHPALGPLNPVSLRIELDAGTALARVDSPYHRIDTTVTGAGRYEVTLADGPVPADRDFELVWQPAMGHGPVPVLFVEDTGREVFALLTVMPPAATARNTRAPRETIFVIDTSGSMAGQSIEQAKAALELAVIRLSPADTFNVIQFNSVTSTLFTGAQPVTPANVAAARRYVKALRAQGGTEMRPALEHALDGIERPGRLRQVVFLTDGLVSNEATLFSLIRAGLADSRLFTVGIGSAPNSHFMRQAAEHGRGTFTYIGNTAEVREKMEALFAKIEAPVLTDVRLELDATTQVEVLPARIPDLYLGEPVVVTLRADMMPVRAVLRGRLGTTDWVQELPLHRTTAAAGLSVQWGREKIAALFESRRLGASEDDVRGAVLAVALAHHLVSPYTSLVAIDVTPARPDGEGLASHMLKTNLPHGLEYAAIFGTGQGATAAQVHFALGLVALLLAAGFYRVLRCRAV